MHAVGIIAEYNPFHNGHAYQAAEARRCSGADVVIAAMSGHFTQRGEIALFDKWSRAASAVAAGVDLVLELPAVYAVRSAEKFAAGGVRLLASLGIVSHLSFGAEIPELHKLVAAASGIENPAVINLLKLRMKAGHPYAVALAETLVACGFADGDFIASPNNILGVEYLRSLQRYAPQVAPLPVKRIGAGYHATGLVGKISSATAIRRQLSTGHGVSQAVADTLPLTAGEILTRQIRNGRAPADPGRIESCLLAKLRLMTQAELQNLPECSEGLENRLARAAQQAGDLAGLLSVLKTKRYPFSRLQRIAAHVLLGTTKTQLLEFDRSGPLYIRVLAANQRGRRAIREIGKTAAIPVITKTSAFLNSQTIRTRCLSPLQLMLMHDIHATDIFSLCLPSPAARTGGLDFLQSPVTRDAPRK